MNPPTQTGCIPLTELAAHIRRQNTEAQQLEINQHLATGCSACATNQNWLAKAFHVATEDHSFALPPAAIANAVAYFKQQTARPPLRQWLAQLVFDSFSAPQLAPVRAEAGATQTPGAGRQMLFQAEGYDIDLRFETHEGQTGEELIGQILAPTAEFSAATITLTPAQDAALHVVQADEHGFFCFPQIPSGVYDIQIQLPAAEIKLVQVATASGQ